MNPLQDYMSIQKLQRHEEKIIIPDNVADRPDKEADLFLVKEIGPGHYENGKFIEPSVKKGDIVFIMGPSVVCLKEKQKYWFARARDVVATF